MRNREKGRKRLYDNFKGIALLCKSREGGLRAKTSRFRLEENVKITCSVLGIGGNS